MTAFSGFFFGFGKITFTVTPFFAINYSIFGKNTFIKRPGKNPPSKGPRWWTSSTPFFSGIGA